MSYFTSPKRLQILIALLIVSNLVSIYVIWKQQSAIGHNHDGSRKTPEEMQKFFVNELDLETLQAKQFFDIRKKHFDKTETILKEIQKIKKSLADEYSSENPEKEKMDSLYIQIVEFEKQLKVKGVQHFFNVRNVLNSIQQKRFTEIFLELRKEQSKQHPKTTP